MAVKGKKAIIRVDRLEYAVNWVYVTGAMRYLPCLIYICEGEETDVLHGDGGNAGW